MPTTRRLAAILAADVAGYSRLIGADERGTLERLRAVPNIAAHNGRIVKTTDALLAEFDPLQCAQGIQVQIAERNLAVIPESRIIFASASIGATSSSRRTRIDRNIPNEIFHALTPRSRDYLEQVCDDVKAGRSPALPPRGLTPVVVHAGGPLEWARQYVPDLSYPIVTTQPRHVRRYRRKYRPR